MRTTSRARNLPIILVTLFGVLSVSGCASLLREASELTGKYSDTEGESNRQRTPIRLDPVERGGSTSADERGDDELSARPEWGEAEELVIEMVNEYRESAGLEPLHYHEELGRIARDHSRDMGSRRFYAHSNPDGEGPNERIEARLGERYYLSGTSENIAWIQDSRLTAGRLQSQVARRLFDGWMNSPGHYANIVRQSSTHIGVGIAMQGTRIYATQKFMNYTARLHDQRESDIDMSLRNHRIVFELNQSGTRRESLVVRVDLPDSSAEWTDSIGRTFRGVAFPEAQWLDRRRFAVRLPIDDYGRGRYGVRFGMDGGNTTSNRIMPFEVN